jgi:hypothetical protein
MRVEYPTLGGNSYIRPPHVGFPPITVLIVGFILSPDVVRNRGAKVFWKNSRNSNQRKFLEHHQGSMKMTKTGQIIFVRPPENIKKGNYRVPRKSSSELM